MSARHVVLIVEDNPDAMATMKAHVESLGHEAVAATTLAEVRAVLERVVPCAVVHDMQIPFVARGREHEKAGVASIGMIRAMSRGPGQIVIIVVTGFRSDPDFVWRTRDLGVDYFIDKKAVETLPDRLLEFMDAGGRADHAACAACNARSRSAGSEEDAGPVARVFSHEKREREGVVVTAAEMAALVGRRAELDLYLNCVAEDARGCAGGFKDRAGKFRELYLQPTRARVLAELVEHRERAVRASALTCLKEAGFASAASALRVLQQARKLVDVNAVVDGRVSRTRWRAFHTAGDKGAPTFKFEPPLGFRWGVIVPVSKGST